MQNVLPASPFSPAATTSGSCGKEIMTQDCSYNELYPLQVLDDSMEPEFPNKCVIVIEPSEVCATGAYVVASVDGERWFRQIIKEANGKARLVALKDGYPEIDLTGKEYKIEGVIVQRNVRREVKHYKPYIPYNGEPLQ
jgi:SOS-response transcriptional repressor LexA